MTNGPRYVLAFAFPLVTALALTPLAGRLARRLGILDHPQGHKMHKQVTPYLGGLAVGGGLLLVAMITAGTSAQLLVILLGALAMASLGLADDWRGVGPRSKLVVEAAAAVALWLAGARGGVLGPDALHLVVTVLWVLAVTNALNMLDNMDGVAPGVAAVSALGFFAIAAARGDYLVASLALAVAGASLGFLRYNFPPARIFLGDAGSLMLGFLLAALGLKLDLVGVTSVIRGALIPFLLLAVPLLDMALVVTARVQERRPVHIGGTDHTAHRLNEQGLAPRQIALAAYFVQAICCELALVLYEAPHRVVVVAGIGIATLASAGLVVVLRLDPPTQEAEIGNRVVSVPEPRREPASERESTG